MHLLKLNDDSSWMWTLNGKRYLVDPWFTPSQVDFYPWFSEQFHISEQPKISELGQVDFIFISHPFTDHCNKETLLQCDPKIPVIADKAIRRKIAKWRHFTTLLSLEEANLQIDKFGSGSMLDPVHNAFVFHTDAGKLLYAPHGSRLKSIPSVDVLITTTTNYTLPFWLGGTINLGMHKAMQLFETTKAKKLITTHDEQKMGKGLVEKLAKKHYENASFLPEILWLKAGEAFVYP
jgi:L-ascorbate metabolism protein UlaG (beta-lactamase superfamily)